jgi:hypothetical protein
MSDIDVDADVVMENPSLFRYICRHQLVDHFLPDDPITPTLHTLNPDTFAFGRDFPIQVLCPTISAEPMVAP